MTGTPYMAATEDSLYRAHTQGDTLKPLKRSECELPKCMWVDLQSIVQWGKAKYKKAGVA